MANLKEKKTRKQFFAFILSVAMVLSLFSGAVFTQTATNAEETTAGETISNETTAPDTEQESTTVTTTDEQESTTAADAEQETTTDGEPSETETSADDTALPTAIGTKITVGSYTYKITGKDTVTMLGFAENVTRKNVIVMQRIVYNNTQYRITQIGPAAFQGETSIKTVLIKKNVKIICKNAFNNCPNLTKVTIKTGLVTVRRAAFKGCKKLNTVNISSTRLTTIQSGAFKSIKKGAVINVMNKSTQKLVKASVPSTVKVNRM